MLRLIGLLLLIPLLDALLLVFLVPRLGWQVVVLLVVLTALLGLFFVRMAGRHTLRRMQRKAARGDPPTNELLDGALLLVAGAFLLTPGLVTDAIGFLLVLPPTRYPIRWGLKRWVVVPWLDGKSSGFVTGNVYVGGFPGEDVGGAGPGEGPGAGGSPGAGGAGGSGTGPTGEGGDGQEVVTDVEFEELDE